MEALLNQGFRYKQKERGPERSVDIELSSPDQRSKKRTIPIWYRSFFKRETGIEPAKHF